MIVAILIGFLFGFIGSMPPAGPIAILVLARSVEGRFRNAISLAVGASLAESAYAFLAFWGYSALLKRYPVILPISRALAAVVLLGLGIILACRKPLKQNAKAPEDRKTGGFLLGFTISALNPTFLVTWTAATATLFSTGLVKNTPTLSVPFSLSACLGMSLWFALVVKLVQHYRERFRQETLHQVVRIFGVALFGLGLWFVWLFTSGLVKG